MLSKIGGLGASENVMVGNNLIKTEIIKKFAIVMVSVEGNIFRKRGECVLLPQKVIVIIIRSGKQMIRLLLCDILIIWDMPSVNLKAVNQWLLI